MKKSNFDVIIIGGGPAGAVSSIYLSRWGLRTAVIERKAFPRETLCGEFLSLEVTELIKSLGLEQKFLSLKPNRITQFKFITGRREFTSRLPFDAFSQKRSVFDEFLLNEASKSGVRLFQPAEAKEVINDEKGFTVRINSGGELIELSSKFVIGAYGKYSQLDKKLERKYADKNTGCYGIKFHICKNELSGIDESCIYIFRGNDIYAGINSVSTEEVTVCFLGRKKSKEVSPSDQLTNLFEENSRLSAMFNNHIPDLKEYTVYGAGNIYFGRKQLIKNGIIMIGDAAGIIAPLAGDGIGMAFQSAKTAAHIIKRAIEDNTGLTSIKRDYKSEWNRQFLLRTAAAGLVQNIILKKSFLNFVPGSLIRLSIPALINATRK